jgi:hypothetical protein
MKKEKRILIREFTTSPCTGCSGAGENNCDNCYDWDTWNSCLTREQAIEKMAKGIGWAFDPYKPAKEEYDNIGNHVLLDGTKKHYKDVAEAALNALLGAKNEN